MIDLRSVLCAMTLAAAPTAAQDICDIPPEDWAAELTDRLVGTYRVESSAGRVLAGTIVYPLPAVSGEIGTMILIDGELVFAGGMDGQAVTMDVTFSPNEVWTPITEEEAPGRPLCPGSAIGTWDAGSFAKVTPTYRGFSSTEKSSSTAARWASGSKRGWLANT